jgi:hypothetical protein
MNLDNAPTTEELSQLLAPCNDSAGHHVLWVSRAGEVNVSCVSPDLPSGSFDQTHPDMQLRYETFQRGNEYVGPDAAGDEEWISELFNSLLNEWTLAKGKHAIRHVRLW